MNIAYEYRKEKRLLWIRFTEMIAVNYFLEKRIHVIPTENTIPVFCYNPKQRKYCITSFIKDTQTLDCEKYEARKMWISLVDDGFIQKKY